MRGMNPHLEEFLENCARAQANIQAQTKLMDHIKDPRFRQVVVENGSFPLMDLIFKHKKYGAGIQEVVITADVYEKGFPSSPFVVIVEENRQDCTYLVQNFGDLTEMFGGPDHLYVEEVKRLQEHLIERGYSPPRGVEGLKPFGIVDGRVVAHDLDANSFSFSGDIINGLSGRGKYAHINKIRKRLREYRLNF